MANIDLSPRDFFSAGGYPTWASTDDRIVGFSGTDVDDRRSTPRYGAMSIDGSQAVSLPSPASETTLEPLGLAGLSDTVILVAGECEDVQSDPDTPCSPSELAVLQLDPVSGNEWQRMALPPGLDGTVVQNVAYSQPTDGGVAFVVTGAEGAPARAFKVSADEVTNLELAVPVATRYCFSGVSLFSLSLGESDDPIAPVGVALLQSRPGEDAQEVELPEMSSGFGGVAVRLACDRDSLYVTSSTSPPAAPEPVVWELGRGGVWQERPDLVANAGSMALSALSSDGGIALSWGAPEGGGGLVTARVGERGVSHDGAPGGEVDWRGLHPSVLITPTFDEDGSNGSTSVQEVDL